LQKGGDVLNETNYTATPETAAPPQKDTSRRKTPHRANKKISQEDIARCLTWNGLWMIRRMRWVKRRVRNLIELVLGVLIYLEKRVIHAFWAFAVRNGLDHTAAVETISRLGEERHSARSGGLRSEISFWLGKIPIFLKRLYKKITSSPSYYLPIMAAVVFFAVVKTTLGSTFALEVVYNGNKIGYIADESVYENAEIQMRGRIAYEDYVRPADAIPRYRIVPVHTDELMSVNDLTDELIRASGNELGEATGLYVDGEFIGAVTNKSELDVMLNSLLDPYRTDNEDETVGFVKDVQQITGLYPLTSITSISSIRQKVTDEEQEERIYNVVSGDSPSLIAQKNGISLSLLYALNPGIESSLLIGQEVIVQQSVPFLEVQITRTEVYEEEVAYETERTVDSSQYEGYYNKTQTGRNGVNEITALVTYLNGVETSREIVSTEVISEPVNEKITVGSKSVAEVGTQTSSSGYIWPAAGGYLSAGLYSYWGHTGMDIAAPAGTSIYASASGIVTKVAYNTTGYGYHIIISHGGNIETLYAHCSKLYVQVGEWVTQGQVIAAVGRTGNATGNHVHFEIRSNGRYLDPTQYIGKVCPY
jgi:murein DD-endopeptidase MepM/ murein hydrolase activator NlpD